MTRDCKYEVECDGMTDPTTWTDKLNTRLEKKKAEAVFVMRIDLFIFYL